MKKLLILILLITSINAQVDYDCFIGEGNGNLFYYVRANSGSGSTSFSSGTNPLDVDVGSNSRPAFADLDGDGDQDCFIGNANGYSKYYENTGSSTSPSFTSRSDLIGDVGGNAAPAFADLDGDGDQDCMIGNSNGYSKYYENTGSSSEPSFTSRSDLIGDIGTNATPAFADLDGDGDMDCFIGNANGYSKYYENTGSSSEPSFTSRSDLIGDIGSNAIPAFVDLDGDGDQDCFIGNGNGYSKYYENTGSSTSPSFTSRSDLIGDIGSSASPVFVNIDGDAVLNTVTISGNAGFRMMSSPVPGVIYSDLLSELWTQGMTGADDTNGDGNVWTYDPAGSGTWNALSNLSTASLTAGQGLLVYVYVDTDNDGDDDVSSGVALTVNGTANGHLGTPITRTTTASKYNLLGNPFVSTIDADQLFTDNGTTNWNSVVYVWNDAADDYYEWNGSAGNLSNGLIAPYQGFWVESKSGGTSYVFKSAARYSASAGTFYRIINGSGKFTVTNGTQSSDSFLSFNSNASIGIDDADANKLMPPAASQRLVSMFYVDGHALSINNFPFEITEDIEIDFDVMMLDAVNDSFYTSVDDITMTWDLTSFPLSIDLFLYDMVTGEIIDVSEMEEFSFYTMAKGGFSAIAQNGIAPYPQIGSPRFKLMITANTVGTENISLPNKFTLHQNYPNPFNPTTTLRYDIPENSHVTIIIYDMLGRHIKTLINQTQDAGYRSVQWNATNDYGKSVSAGIYLYQIQAGEYISTKKMVLLK